MASMVTGRVELFVQVVRGAGGERGVRLQVERDADVHGSLPTEEAHG